MCDTQADQPMKWLGSRPSQCEFCLEPLPPSGMFFDTKIAQGPWGILGECCFVLYGAGLGLGKGQKYDIQTLNKLTR